MDAETKAFINEITAMLSELDRGPSKKLKLIIHVGTPKTGTTSLQTYLDKKQRKLRKKGFLYPHNLDTLKNPNTPKHQWFEKNLLSNNLISFAANFKNVLSQVKTDTHTIILSSEGIYNYWWDFPKSAKVLLSALSELFNTKIWVWFREPLGFVESYYKQCMRNPQVVSNPCYGKNISLANMLEITWFSRHLDYQGFVDECQLVFGNSHVCAFQYTGDVVQKVAELFALTTPHDNPTPRQNKSLHSAVIDMLIALNQYDLKAKDKDLLMPHIKEINDVIAHYPEQKIVDEVTRAKILTLANPVKFNGV